MGSSLVIVGAVVVILEVRIISRQIHSELLDIPDLAHSLDQVAGAIGDPRRRGHDPVPKAP